MTKLTKLEKIRLAIVVGRGDLACHELIQAIANLPLDEVIRPKKMNTYIRRARRLLKMNWAAAVSGRPATQSHPSHPVD